MEAYARVVDAAVDPEISGRARLALSRLLERAGNDPDRIDFKALAARAEHEQELLERMLAYAKGGRCLRREILEYFDAPEVPEACEGCDRCRPSRVTPAPRERTSKAGAAKRKAGAAKRKAGAAKRRAGAAKQKAGQLFWTEVSTVLTPEQYETFRDRATGGGKD